MQVQRFDFATIGGKPTRTPQGFLRIDANLTRTGVLLYANPDGSVRRELRLPEEVFDSASLATLGGVPVTDLHPNGGMVNPENVTTLQRGRVSDAVAKDTSERFITGSVIVQDKALIDAVERGDRRELSPGYTCVLDETPGEWNGEHYDCIQRAITYNHLALGPKGWGRSGSEVALRMDSGLVSYESKAASSGSTALANLPAPSPVLGAFVREKLVAMDKSVGHLAEAIGVDVWAVDSFLDGCWGRIADNKRAIEKPNGPRIPETGIAARAEIEMVAKFIGVDADTLFELVPVAERGDGRNTQRKRTTKRIDAMETETVEYKGFKIEVPAQLAGALKKAISEEEEAMKTATDEAAAAEEKVVEEVAKADAAKARADAADAKVVELQAKLDAATSPEAIAAAVKARVELEGVARKIVGDKADFAGKADADIKVEVIKHVDSKFDATGKSPEYLAARFDATTANVLTEQARADANGDAYRGIAAGRADGGTDKSEAQKRQDAAEKSRNAWKTKTAAQA